MKIEKQSISSFEGDALQENSNYESRETKRKKKKYKLNSKERTINHALAKSKKKLIKT